MIVEIFKKEEKVKVKDLYGSKVDGYGVYIGSLKDGRYRIRVEENDMILHIEPDRVKKI